MSDWLEKMGVSILKNNEGNQQLLNKLFDTARPQSVFAPPVTAGEYTVITASEVYVGLGVGYGGGGGSGPAPHEEGAEDEPAAAEQAAEESQPEAVGIGVGGGGGGVSLGRPVAAITIGPDGVEVKPIVDVTKIVLAWFTMAGAVALMWSRMSRLSSGRRAGRTRS